MHQSIFNRDSLILWSLGTEDTSNLLSWDGQEKHAEKCTGPFLCHQAINLCVAQKVQLLFFRTLDVWIRKLFNITWFRWPIFFAFGILQDKWFLKKRRHFPLAALGICHLLQYCKQHVTMRQELCWQQQSTHWKLRPPGSLGVFKIYDLWSVFRLFRA